MVRVAIIEDELQVQEQLTGYLARYTRQYGTVFDIAVFTDGDELLEDYHAKYDILLMDIEMKRLDGMETAHRVRKVDDAVTIIFITNTPTYAIRGYSVGALDYMLKPVAYFSFSEQIKKALRQIQSRMRFDLTIPQDGGMRRLDTATIYYVESDGHYVHFVTETGEFETRAVLKAVEEQLSSRPFARCNNSFLVNLAQVSGMKQETVLVGPYQLPLSRTRRKSFLDAMSAYIASGAHR